MGQNLQLPDLDSESSGDELKITYLNNAFEVDGHYFSFFLKKYTQIDNFYDFST